MGLSLHIDGDPAAIRAAAHWLDPDVYGPLQNADAEMVSMVMNAEDFWTGESGYAFNLASQAVRRGNFDVPTYAQDVAEVMRAYAGRLERGADDFAAYAKTAESKGLRVAGNTIVRPTTSLKYCPDPQGSDTEAIAQYNTYLAKLTSYNGFCSDVGTWWGELDVWVSEHFTKLIGDISKLSEANDVLEGLQEGNEKVVEFALNYADARLERNLESFRSRVTEMQEQSKTLHRQLRSGNPALRAAAEAADPKGLRRAANALSETISGVSRAGKIIPVAGVMIEIVATGKAIADGDSGSSALVGLGGAVTGGVSAGVIITATGIAVPPVGVAILVGLAAWGASEVATNVWEAVVPLDTREAIDDGISDVFSFLNPFD